MAEKLRCFDRMEESRGREDKSGNVDKNEFYTAIMDEDLDRIEEISKKYGSNFFNKIPGSALANVSCKGQAALSLHLAASNRKVKSMQSLLSTGADPEMRDQLGRTPLHLVIAGWPCVRTSWPIPGCRFQTAVFEAQMQSEACLRLLCEHGVDVNAEVEGSGHTALHLSVRYEALSAVQNLADSGADVNAVDRSGMTPLHMAAGILHKDIMASLIKKGADITVGVRPSGNTPLHMAVVAMAMKSTKILEDDISCVSMLVELGAEVNAVNKAGLTPLQEACIMGDDSLVDLLLRYGADINQLNNARENCLFLFLNHRRNVRNSSLLVKLLSLTSPLTVYNRKGHLPSTLMQPCFSKQRDQLLKLSQHPKRLQDICKSYVYLKHVQNKREELRKVLPEGIYDFVFNQWENLHNISFVTDADQDPVNDLLHVITS